MSEELNQLSKTMAGKPLPEIRGAVENAFGRYDLAPGDIGEIVEAIHAGETIPSIQTRVPPVHIDPAR